VSYSSAGRKSNKVMYWIYFEFDHQDELWAIISLKILFSILIRGVTATHVMEYLKK